MLYVPEQYPVKVLASLSYAQCSLPAAAYGDTRAMGQQISLIE